jgi:hypothetical protein
MYVGHRAKLLVLIAVCCAAQLAWSKPACAYHSKEERLTEDTAYTLQKRRLRLGLFKIQYGIWDPFMVGTYTAPWIVALANFHFKWRYLNSEHWAAALQVGFGRLDVSKLEAFEDEPGDAIINVGTFEPSVSYRFNDRYTLSATVPYSRISAVGTINTDALKGALDGAVDNLQLTTTFEWRWTRVTALVVHARYLLFQRAYGDGNATLYPDEFTRVDVSADAETGDLNFKYAWSVVPSLAFSWKHFNLRIGLGYGNWSIPPVNFVLPEKTVIPDLDVYWVF